jgi:hypothetical protein
MNQWLRHELRNCPFASIQRIFLVGFLLTLPGIRVPVQAGVDCISFYRAIDTGNEATALEIGQDLYTRLAVQAEGREPFYSSGVALVTGQHATEYVTGLCAGQSANGCHYRGSYRQGSDIQRCLTHQLPQDCIWQVGASPSRATAHRTLRTSCQQLLLVTEN